MNPEELKKLDDLKTELLAIIAKARTSEELYDELRGITRQAKELWLEQKAKTPGIEEALIFMRPIA